MFILAIHVRMMKKHPRVQTLRPKQKSIVARVCQDIPKTKRKNFENIAVATGHCNIFWRKHMSKEFILKTPDAPATISQGVAIRRLTGEDIREREIPLTMKQAMDIISKAKSEKPASSDNPARVPYSQMMKEAVKAANLAGKAWLETAKPTYIVASPRTGKDLGYPPMLDVCGHVYIDIVDKRTSFARWIAKQQNGYNDVVRVDYQYRGRQEMGLKEACERAALAVFEKHGADKGLRIFSRID
jgi:hypothetical protein